MQRIQTYEMRQLLLVAGLLAVTGAVTVPSQTLEDALRIEDVAGRNSVMAQIILNYLEEFRVIMTTGSDKIPVLDPLVINHIDLKGEDFGVSGLSLAASDISVNNLSTFVVDSLEVTSKLMNHKITFDINIPSLEIHTGSYSLQAEVMGFNVFGEGSARLKFLYPRLHGSIMVKISLPTFEGLAIDVTSADLTLGLAGFESQITGLFGDEHASELANGFLMNFVPEAVIKYQNEISVFLNKNVPVILNEILADIL